MWSLDSRWFDVAMVMTLFAIGNICFGRFEEHKSRGRRIAKVVVFVAAFLGLIWAGGRLAGYSVIGVFGLLAVYVHAFWLPSKGINGWTAEPRDKYLELITARKR